MFHKTEKTQNSSITNQEGARIERTTNINFKNLDHHGLTSSFEGMTFHIFSLSSECPHFPSFIPNGFVGGSGSVEGSQCRFSCKEGYSLVGAYTLQNTDQGNWNGSVPTFLKGTNA